MIYFALYLAAAAAAWCQNPDPRAGDCESVFWRAPRIDPSRLVYCWKDTRRETGVRMRHNDQFYPLFVCLLSSLLTRPFQMYLTKKRCVCRCGCDSKKHKTAGFPASQWMWLGLNRSIARVPAFQRKTCPSFRSYLENYRRTCGWGGKETLTSCGLTPIYSGAFTSWVNTQLGYLHNGKIVCISINKSKLVWEK